MKHLLKILIGSCVIVALVAFFPKTAAAGGVASNILIGAAATSEDDVWAVGESLNSVGTQTLIEHWNGSTWKVVPSPNPAGAQFNVFEGVAALSGDDAWAVGGSTHQGGSTQTLIERWNGSNWKIVPSPNPAGAISSFFNSVSIVSEDDAWAVGVTEDRSGILHTLIEHLVHDTWVIVNSPSPGPQSNFLQGVSAVSEDDVWAVGDFVDSSNAELTLIEHWNGSAWTVVPSSTAVNGVLNGVAAVSKTSVWAVGSNGAETLTERWNGTSWNVVTSPNPVGNRFSRFTAVTVAAKKNVWAVGDYVNSAGSTLTLTEHWNGSAWSIISSPNPAGANINSLQGAAAVPHEADDEDGGVWAVGGDTLPNGTSFTLVEHWNGVKWRIVPSPTP